MRQIFRDMTLALLLQISLQLTQYVEARTFVLPDPPLCNLVDRDRIQIVQLVPALPAGDDQAGLLKQSKMLGDRLPRHLQPRAQLVQGLAVLHKQRVQQMPATPVCQRTEDCIFIHDSDYMQPFGCMSSRDIAVKLN